MSTSILAISHVYVSTTCIDSAERGCFLVRCWYVSIEKFQLGSNHIQSSWHKLGLFFLQLTSRLKLPQMPKAGSAKRDLANISTRVARTFLCSGRNKNVPTERLCRTTNSETDEGVTIIQPRIYVKDTIPDHSARCPTELNKVPIEQISSILFSTTARNIRKKCHGSTVINSSQIVQAP
jgi:hypothetical protein